MKRHLWWVAVMVLFTAFQTHAQTDSCGSDWLQDYYTSIDSAHWLKKKSIGNRAEHYRQIKNKLTGGYSPGQGATLQTLNSGCNRTRYVIPVVFHIDTTDTATNISDAQVLHQLQILNTAYWNAGTEIQFCLATKRPNGSTFSGINRIGDSLMDNRLNMQLGRLIQQAYYNPALYLNVYVVKDILNDTGGATGITGYNNAYPGQSATDAVVVKYTYFGNSSTCIGCNTLVGHSKGMTLVHEVGHYLGLFHPFDGGCNAGNTAATCGIQGDNCCDTRPQAVMRFSCDTGYRSCSTYHLNIDDNMTNFMTYAKDSCLDNFTADQIDIMHSTLESPRSSLVSPLNINARGLSCCMVSALFIADNTLLCLSSETVTFTALEYSDTAYYRWIIKDSSGTPVKDTTLLNNHTYSYTFTQNNRYSVTLEIIYDGGDTLRFTRADFIEKLNCSQPLQSIHANWYFGRYAGLKFTTAGPVRDLRPRINAPISNNTDEGTFGTSNPFGRLLFYCGARPIFDALGNLDFNVDVYNRNYTRVANSPLYGFGDAVQGGVVVPKPGDGSKYYIFSLSILSGFHYSVFDTTLNGGLGAIISTERNKPVLAPPGAPYYQFGNDSSYYAAEGITAIPKCNGNDYWILVVGYSTTGIPNPFKVAVYSLDSTGISFHSFLPFIISDPTCAIKASPDGTKIAIEEAVLNFDRSNATATLLKRAENSYQNSFSPNSNLLYYLTGDYNSNISKLHQLDLYSSDSATSDKIVGEFPHPYFMSLQLGPDNKIYLSKAGVGQLGVINQPDSIINTLEPNKCGLNSNGPLLSSNGLGGECVSGLPNNVDAKAPADIPLDFAHIDSACSIVRFYPNTDCVSSYKWYFGDGDSSSDKKPSHTYATEGSYTVQLKINGITIKSKVIRIGIDKPEIAGNDSVSCKNSGPYVYSVSNRDNYLTYTWQVSGAGTLISTDNIGNGNIQWSGNGFAYLTATDKRTGCFAKDTLKVIRTGAFDKDSIWVGSQPCINPDTVLLYGDQYSGSTYQWYRSNDGVSWNLIAGQSNDTLSYIMNADSLYFRRKVLEVDSACNFFSYPIKVKPQIYIKRQPQDYVACLNGSRMFTVEVANPLGVSITYVWQYQLKGSSQWSAQFVLGDTVIEGFTPAAFDSAKYRCTISTPCGSIASNAAYTFVLPAPGFITHPQSTSVNEEDSTLLTAKGNQPGPESYQWFYSWDGGTNWDSIPGEHNDTLIIRNSTMCQSGYKYKAKYFNQCTPYSGAPFSDSATLNVIKTRFADLWWRDENIDNGVEPFNDTNGIWYSPDLWVRLNADNDTNPQSPNYDTAAPNYVHYKIRNRGTDTSKGGELYLYWTKTGMGERWPTDWTTNASNVRVNPCVGTIYYNNSYAMGGEINSTPINIPAIPPGGSIIGSVAWFPPNPYWYGTRQRILGTGVNVIPETIDVCLLGRILHCDRDSFGLARKEVELLRPNVYKNNNIVTRNVIVTNINRIQRRATSWVGARNPDGQTPCSDIKLPANAPFSAVGTVTIHLDEIMLNAWEASGLLGSGFTMIDSSTLRVTPYQDFVLNNVCFNTGEFAQIGVEFELDSPATYTSAATFQFKIGQYKPSTDIIMGAVNIDVNTTMDGYDSSEGHVDSLDFTISPNPTSPGMVSVTINSNFSTTGVTLNVYDGFGNPVISPYIISNLSSGGQIETVNLSGVSSGTYTMTITANGNNYSGIVVVL